MLWWDLSACSGIELGFSSSHARLVCWLFVPIGFIWPTVKQRNQYHQLLPLKPHLAVTDHVTDYVESTSLGTSLLFVPINHRSLKIPWNGTLTFKLTSKTHIRRWNEPQKMTVFASLETNFPIEVTALVATWFHHLICWWIALVLKFVSTIADAVAKMNCCVIDCPT